jgi:Ras-related protein Rab-28
MELSGINDEEEVVTYQYKVILLGDGAVGKTSISIRFSEDQFSQQYKQTIGVDFFTKRIELTPRAQVTLQLWDIGGQSIGSKMLGNYVAGAHAILLCYDITNYESFANLEDWYRLVSKVFVQRGKELPYCALIANKNDLRHLTAVRTEQHNAFAEENGFASYLISAKNGDQVTSTFVKVASKLAGIELDARVAEGRAAVSAIPATIIDHKQHDETVNDGKLPEIKSASGYGCSVC